ncbi:accessory gene regulator B family protein [Marinicrinis sediminis]|uniref:Accessory gene regulator B family protein n=1 Tax=Marinicrinis sediminis TaxID=1652465 RepID=A0ABW5RF88_9BACL
MLDLVAEKVAIRIKNSHPDSASIEVLKHGLLVSIDAFSVPIVSLIIAWYLGTVPETLLTIFTFFCIRFFSGGLHLKSALNCFILSTTIIIALPYIATTIPDLSSLPVILTILSVISLLIFAPANVQYSRLPIKYYPLFKTISVIIACSNFFILSKIIAFTLFTQAILIVKLRR